MTDEEVIEDEKVPPEVVEEFLEELDDFVQDYEEQLAVETGSDQ